MADKHSWFSPSAASRNIACPAAAKLNQNGGNSSSYADRGTECHAAMQEWDLLGRRPDSIDDLPDDWQSDAIFDAMNQRSNLFQRMGAIPTMKLELEAEVSLADYGRSDIFGTVDVIGVDDNRLFIVDYKFGAGVSVSAHMNPQLMIYALGALAKYKDIYDVVLVIIQPRLFQEPLVFETNPGFLKEWYRDTLLPAIVEAESDDPRFNPGEDQCRWCAAANKGCPAQVQQLKDMLPVANQDPTVVTNDSIADLLKKIPDLKAAMKQVEAVAFDRMMNGDHIPGFKLVRKNTKRTWAEPDKVDVFLQRRKLKMDERFKMTLISPAQAEKKLAANGMLTPRLLTALEKHIVKPKGEPTWAPETDKRDEYIPVNPVDLLPEQEDVDVDDLF